MKICVCLNLLPRYTAKGGGFFLTNLKAEKMDNTFYSELDGFLFWVAGYTADTNTANVVKQAESLLKEAQFFADFAGVQLETVRTFCVEKSQRYKHMRVFYVDMSPERAPESSFKLGVENGWTMWKWIEN